MASQGYPLAPRVGPGTPPMSGTACPRAQVPRWRNRTSASPVAPALPLALRGAAALLVVAATGFDYVWTGPVPAWLVAAAIGLVMTLAHRGGGRALAQTSRLLRGAVIGPWMALLFAIALSDAFNGSLEESAREVVLLGLLGIG